MREIDVLRELRRRHLLPFVAAGFEHLHPAQPFLLSKHVEAMCHALEEVAFGRRTRQLITVPPRHGKSICASVCLAAWILGRDPSKKIIVASYGGDLAIKHARDFRGIVTADWYQRLFPKMSLVVGGNRLDEQITTLNGGRKAVSLGGAVTGFGADVIIIDDLTKAADAISPVERQRVKDYYEQSLLSRLDNKSTGQIIVIQQRLHEDDLPGYLIGSGQFHHLNLPAIATGEENVPIGFGKMWRRRKDEALCPERESLDALRQLRIEMGAFAFSAQYQQDPTPLGGNRLRWDWFKAYDEEFERADFQCVVQSWDTALTAEPTSDFSVGTTWAFSAGQWYLIDLVRARLDFPDLKRRVLGAAKKWNPDRVLIEHAGSGISLLQQLRRDERRPGRFVSYKSPDDKITRAEAQTARLETGCYLVPSSASWLEEFRREVTAFPMGKYDDQVDSLIQFVDWTGSRRARGMLDRNPETGRPQGAIPRQRLRRSV